MKTIFIDRYDKYLYLYLYLEIYDKEYHILLISTKCASVG